LLHGKKSGVLGNVDEFELDVVRNKIKLNMKKEMQITTPAVTESVADNDVKGDETASENEATATQELGSLSVTDRAEEMTPEEMNRKFMAEIAMLEEKRKLMENYFRSKNMLPSSSKDKESDRRNSSSDEKRHADDKRRRKSSERTHRHSSSDDRSHKHKKKDRKKEKEREREKVREKERGRGRRESERERDKKKKYKDRRRSRSREKRKEKNEDKKPEVDESPPADDDVLSFLEMMSELDKQVAGLQYFFVTDGGT
jgi:hypothetical protein